MFWYPAFRHVAKQALLDDAPEWVGATGHVGWKSRQAAKHD